MGGGGVGTGKKAWDGGWRSPWARGGGGARRPLPAPSASPNPTPPRPPLPPSPTPPRPPLPPSPTPAHQVEVQLVGGGLGRPAGQLGQRARAKEERRRARRGGQHLLGPRVRGVHEPGVSKKGDATQRCHRVDDEERAGLPACRADAGERLVHAGGRLALDEEGDRRPLLVDGSDDVGRGDSLAGRRGLHLHNLGPKPASHVGHAVAPDARVDDQNLISTLD